MKKKLVRITTLPDQIRLQLQGQPMFFTENGFDVSLLSSKGESDQLELIKDESGIDVIIMPYTRVISPFKDILAIWKTYKYLKNNKPDIVHTHSPKAGLVGMISAKLANIPIRMHTVAGLPLMEASGVKRVILNYVERLTSWGANFVYPNSKALMSFMDSNRLVPSYKLRVIGNGGTNGVDTNFFHRTNCTQSQLSKIKTKFSIDRDDFIFIYIGRIVRDKGLNELLYAFDNISKRNINAKLLLVGSDSLEVNGLISNKSYVIINENLNVINVGWQNDIRPFLAISDVFVFPSYREGFPNVVLQACSMGIPSIVTDINGSNEIIKNNFNGLIVPTKDSNSLQDAMLKLIEDNSLLNKLSENSRKRIIENYDQKFVWNELLKEYNNLLEKKSKND